MKILVRNLSRQTTAETISQLFAEYGEVTDAVIVYDEQTKQSKGFGFVEMSQPKNAILAIKRLNLHKLEGQVIRVKLAEQNT